MSVLTCVGLFWQFSLFWHYTCVSLLTHVSFDTEVSGLTTICFDFSFDTTLVRLFWQRSLLTLKCLFWHPSLDTSPFVCTCVVHMTLLYKHLYVHMSHLYRMYICFTGYLDLMWHCSLVKSTTFLCIRTRVSLYRLFICLTWYLCLMWHCSLLSVDTSIVTYFALHASFDTDVPWSLWTLQPHYK